MRKPRRIPRPVITDPVAYVTANVATLPSHTKAYMLLTASVLTSLDNLLRAEVHVSDIKDITAMGYMSLALYNLGAGVDERTTVIEGIKAINSVNQRYKVHKVYRGNASEIAAIRALAGVHISQLNEATIPVLKEAISFLKQSLTVGKAKSL